MSDNNRKLRHHIRNCMYAYAMYHPESPLALNGMAVALTSLGGRPGLTLEERAERVSRAHDAIAEVFAADEFNQLLIEAHSAVHVLMELTGVTIPESPEVKAPTPDPEVDSILAQYEEEFSDTKE